MALGSTQTLTEMSTRNIFRGKGGRCIRLTNLPSSCAIAMKPGNLIFLEPSGPLQACNGTNLLIYICTFIYGTYSSVGIATDYGLDIPGSNSGADAIFRPPDRPWGSPSLM